MDLDGLLEELHGAGIGEACDLVAEAKSAGRALPVCFELRDTCQWISATISSSSGHQLADYHLLDEALRDFVRLLVQVGIVPIFYADVPAGAGILDRCCPMYTSFHIRSMEASVQQPALPSLWLEQAMSTLQGLQLEVSPVFLPPQQQAPLWRPQVAVDIVITNNVSWCLTADWRAIPFRYFDTEGAFKRRLTAGKADGPSDPGLTTLSARYLSAHVLHAALELGSPLPSTLPQQHDEDEAKKSDDVEMQSSEAEAVRNSVAKEKVVVELLLLRGNAATASAFKRLQLYHHLGLGRKESLQTLALWLRQRIFGREPINPKDFRLEAMEPLFEEAARRHADLRYAFRFLRLVSSKDVAGLTALGAAWYKHLGLPSCASVLPATAEFPTGLSAPLQALACGASDVFLDRLPELSTDIAVNDIVSSLTGELRRLNYSFVSKELVEHCVSSAGKLTSKDMRLAMSLQGSLPDLWATWNPPSRLRIAVRCVEHNLLKYPAAKAGAEGNSRTVPGTAEELVWADPEECQCPVQAMSYLRLLFTYLVSLNLRPDGPELVPHELDSMLCCTMLAGIGGSEELFAGSPLYKCSLEVTARVRYVRQEVGRVCDKLFATDGSGIEVLPRAVELLEMWQGVALGLNDLIRLLGLNSAAAAVGEGSIQVLEPKMVFGSSYLFAGFFCAGAFAEGELEVSGPVEALLTELAQYRCEMLKVARENGDWIGEFARTLPEGMLQWPEEEAADGEDGAANDEAMAQSAHEEDAQGSQEGVLPIAKYKQEILQAVACQQVTYIQGAPACGKSLLVPAMLADASEGNRILSTQPTEAACKALVEFATKALPTELADHYQLRSLCDANGASKRVTYVATWDLLKALVHNPDELQAYSHVVLDEVQDRSAASDILYLLVKVQLLKHRFRLLIMSSTLEANLFSAYFGANKRAGTLCRPLLTGARPHPVATWFLDDVLSRASGLNGTPPKRLSLSERATAALSSAKQAFDRCAPAWENQDDQVDSSWCEETVVAAEWHNAEAMAQSAPPASVVNSFELVTTELVSQFAQAGQFMMIYLPGLAEMLELQTALVEASPSTGVPWQVILLHGASSLSDGDAAFAASADATAARIVLCTDDAVTAVGTVPNTPVVIDWGLRRVLTFNKGFQSCVEQTTWISKARAFERSGRTARTGPGLVIRLYTKAFHDRAMRVRDLPEPRSLPMEKLLVDARFLASKLPPPAGSTSFTSTRMLHLTPSAPPEPTQLLAHLARLDECGAVSSRGEQGRVTELGVLLSALPLDLRLCRLVLQGALMGCVLDALVMAAGLTTQAPLERKAANEGFTYRRPVGAAAAAAQGAGPMQSAPCSEPLILHSMFLSWLRLLSDERSKGAQLPRMMLLHQCSKLFARSHPGVHATRLTRYAAALLTIGTRLLPTLDPSSRARLQLSSLLALLSPHGLQQGLAPPPCYADLGFCGEPWRLKAMLVGAFAPQLLLGKLRVRSTQGPEEDVEVLTRLVRKSPLSGRVAVASVEATLGAERAAFQRLVQTAADCQHQLTPPLAQHFLAVFASAASPKPPAATELEGVTVLEGDAEVVFSLALLLAFHRLSEEIELEVDDDAGVIEKIRWYGTSEVSMRNYPSHVLLMQDLELINALRSAMSDNVRALASDDSNSTSCDGASLRQERRIAPSAGGIAAGLLEGLPIAREASDVKLALDGLRTAVCKQESVEVRLRCRRPELPQKLQCYSLKHASQADDASFRLFVPFEAGKVDSPPSSAAQEAVVTQSCDVVTEPVAKRARITKDKESDIAPSELGAEGRAADGERTRSRQECAPEMDNYNDDDANPAKRAKRPTEGCKPVAADAAGSRRLVKGEQIVTTEIGEVPATGSSIAAEQERAMRPQSAATGAVEESAEVAAVTLINASEPPQEAGTQEAAAAQDKEAGEHSTSLQAAVAPEKALSHERAAEQEVKEPVGEVGEEAKQGVEEGREQPKAASDAEKKMDAEPVDKEAHATAAAAKEEALQAAAEETDQNKRAARHGDGAEAAEPPQAAHEEDGKNADHDDAAAAALASKVAREADVPEADGEGALQDLAAVVAEAQHVTPELQQDKKETEATRAKSGSAEDLALQPEACNEAGTTDTAVAMDAMREVADPGLLKQGEEVAAAAVGADVGNDPTQAAEAEQNLLKAAQHLEPQEELPGIGAEAPEQQRSPAAEAPPETVRADQAGTAPAQIFESSHAVARAKSSESRVLEAKQLDAAMGAEEEVKAETAPAEEEEELAKHAKTEADKKLDSAAHAEAATAGSGPVDAIAVAEAVGMEATEVAETDAAQEVANEVKTEVEKMLDSASHEAATTGAVAAVAVPEVASMETTLAADKQEVPKQALEVEEEQSAASAAVAESGAQRESEEENKEKEAAAAAEERLKPDSDAAAAAKGDSEETLKIAATAPQQPRRRIRGKKSRRSSSSRRRLG